MTGPDLFNFEFRKLAGLDFVRTVPDYQGRNADFYDSVQGGFQKDVQFYLKTIGSSPRTVLELGGGTGRIAIPVAAAGHTVHALDRSDDMLRALAAKVPQEIRDRVIPVKASMTDFDIDIRFDYVILGLNTAFNLLTEDDRIACFTLARKHLVEGGRFLLDLMLPTSEDLKDVSGRYNLTVLDGPDGRRGISVVFSRYDARTQLSTLNFLSIDVGPDGRAEFTVTPALEYYPSAGEMRVLLRSCGFSIESFSCDYEGTPFDQSSSSVDMVICALASS